MARYNQLTERDKDEIAAGVLAVVREVGRMLRAPLPDAPEPTGVFVPEDVRRHVERRAS